MKLNICLYLWLIVLVVKRIGNVVCWLESTRSQSGVKSLMCAWIWMWRKQDRSAESRLHRELHSNGCIKNALAIAVTKPSTERIISIEQLAFRNPNGNASPAEGRNSEGLAEAEVKGFDCNYCNYTTGHLRHLWTFAVSLKPFRIISKLQIIDFLKRILMKKKITYGYLLIIYEFLSFS